MGDADSSEFWDAELFREVIRQVEGTDIDELELVEGSFRLYLRRNPTFVPVAPAAQDAQPVEQGIPVPAPLTGVFYTRPGPDEAEYVSTGDRVHAGQVVGLIETMKLFNEVTVETAGEIVAMLAADGDLVETGQPLMRLVPMEDEDALPPQDVATEQLGP